MSDDLPHPVASSTFTIGPVEMVCHVLSSGERVIEEASMVLFLEALGRGDVFPEADLFDFYRWMRQRP